MKNVFYFLLSSLASMGVFAQSGQTADGIPGYGNTSWVAAGNDPEQMKSVPLRSDSRATAEADYTQGAFIVNEDWYGHQNSTVNFLTDQGEWIYRIFQKENPGHELGCTTQFGTIYGGKFYLVSKQQKDPGAKITGSRFAVCDAKTMKVIKEFEFIATKTVTGKQGQDSIVSIADGRSYLPVDEHKGYIGTSNGIWLYDSDNMTIGEQIKGSGNPNEDEYGHLYYAQIGTMLRANDYVFAVHQQDGLLIIDAKTDQIVRTIAAPIETDIVDGKEKEEQRGFGSIVRSKDGNLWISMTKNTSGMGAALNYMLKLNPYTFKVDTVNFPSSEGIEAIPNSWYAWTADGFCASTKENKIYWNGYGTGSWFTGYKIFCYDIDKNKFSLVYNIGEMPGDWRLYGTGFRIHPVTDELYCFFYHDFNDPNHELARISSSGELLQEYPMIINYWFPALPVFPDNEAPVVSSKFPATVELTQKEPTYKLYLGDMVTDEDNQAAAIVKTVSSVTPQASIHATVQNDSLIVAMEKMDQDIQAIVTVQFNSNGQIVTRDIAVKAYNSSTSSEKINSFSVRLYPNPAIDRIFVEIENPSKIDIFSIKGECLLNTDLSASGYVDVSSLRKGVYIVQITSQGKTAVTKLIKQ